MTREEAKKIINAHNDEIDNFIYNEIPKLLNLTNLTKDKNGEYSLTMEDWFKANELIRKQDFYKKGKEILNMLRDDMHNVKMDMQSNKLILY